MSTGNEEIRRQLGFGQGLPHDLRDMAFSVKCKTPPESPAEKQAVPIDPYFLDDDNGAA